MGFYGNITNASRTQFSFDKIYPNKYEMFANATTDGVYVGRYALVEYDLDTGADTYTSTLYKYGDNMYLTTEAEYFNGYSLTNSKLLLKQPLPKDRVTNRTIINNSTLKDGDIVRIIPGHNFQNLNEYHICIRVTQIHFDEDHQTGIFTYEGVSDETYESYINDIYGNDNSKYSKAIDFTEYDFEPGFYYIKDNETGEYQLAQEYDKNETYYILGKGEKIYLCGDEQGFFYWSVINDTGYTIPREGEIYIVRKGCSYQLNTEEELWTVETSITDENNSFLFWKKIVTDNQSNYYKNFNIDKISFPKDGRGYDSTVWQKVYASGEQYYIMVAELNTILPNFAVTAEAPTMLPLLPHFDADSTNIYYNLHIQPQWGFRVKAANANLLGDLITKNGLPSGISSVQLREKRIDPQTYPSDQTIVWSSVFYNKNTNQEEEYYYNVVKGLWEKYDEENDSQYALNAAIYFNKDGFNVENICYSGDILKDNTIPRVTESGWKNDNEISIMPSGKSGYQYPNHNDSLEDIISTDTQELSIMLPALGDSIAQMWDLIYGGRLTNDIIAETNKRNLDISWEDANKSILRSGLRLVEEEPGADGFTLSYNNAETDWNGDVLNSGEINTLAGCINSVHDLMGMILVNTTEEDLQDQQMELANQENFEDYKNIDGNKIYYFANDGTYRRKHETFQYQEVEYTYIPVELEEGNFRKNFYYYLDIDGETMVPSYDDEFDENRSYYIKKMDANVLNNQVYIPINNLKAFDAHGRHFPYQKTLNGDFIYDDSEYAADDDTVYYHVTNTISNKMNLSGDYEPNKYFYYEENDYDENNNLVLKWTLSEAKEASNIQYYTLTPRMCNKNLEFPEDLYDGIGNYFYCPGFFYYEDYTLLSTDQYRLENVGEYYKQIASPVETNEVGIYNANGKLYIPLDGNEYTITDNEVNWGSLWGNIYVKSGKIALDKSELMTKGRQYYAVFTEINEENTSYVLDDDGNLVPAISSTAYDITKYMIIMEPYLGNKYYRIGDQVITYQHSQLDINLSEEEYEELEEEAKLNYSKIVSIKTYELMTESSAELALKNDYNKQFKQQKKEFINYYEITASATDAFYGAKKYWYNTYEDKLLTDALKDEWETAENNEAFSYGNWIIDTSKTITNNRRYYLSVISQKESGPYYKPNYYYYYNNELQQYVLDNSATMRENTTYYKKNNFYIIEDKTGKFSKGAIWKYANTGIPCVIKIGSRTSFYEMQELVGFARTFNTIHGLILRINNLLELDDSLTRNTKTVQGCINTLNDIINKFDELEFNKILITDSAGRIITEDLENLQIAYGPNNSKKITFGQMLNKFDEIETKADSLTFITDADMTAIINS